MGSRELTILHIFSPSYSGSTWLNLLLGAHPDAFSVGELKTVLKIGRPACTLHGEMCPVWSRPELQDLAVDDTASVYERLATITGKPVYVVNNSRKFRGHESGPAIRRRYLHLVRDGRAVIASHLRKFPDRSTWEACRTWKREVRRNDRLMRRMPKDATMRVSYEDLQSDIEGGARAICAFAGLAFDPAMLAFWSVDHHFLGGNRGTLFSLTRQADRELPDDPDDDGRTLRPNWDMGFYRDAGPQTFVDQRWKEELGPGRLRLFGLYAGRLNRRFGYA